VKFPGLDVLVKFVRRLVEVVLIELLEVVVCQSSDPDEAKSITTSTETVVKRSIKIKIRSQIHHAHKIQQHVRFLEEILLSLS
jgi:hypothetical protein